MLGIDIAIGFVDKSRSVPPHGGTWLELPTATYIPIISSFRGIRAYSEAGPAWFDELAPTHATP